METKQYLLQIKRLERTIKNKMTEIMQVEILAHSISAIKTEDKVQTSPNFDKIGGTLAKIEHMESQLCAAVDEYLDKRDVIIRQIEDVEDDLQYTILFSKYVENKTFETIAEETNYTSRNIGRLHGIALKEFEKLHGHTYLAKSCR